ncbi:MAG: hypothetical protein U9Q99_00225 [Nanoarchaeota archaeon]|nr:hypothetical protein [Nanoarchaeota archaeon]
MEIEKGYVTIKKEVPILGIPNQDFKVIWEPVKGNYASQRNQLRERGIQKMITSPQSAHFLGDAYENKNQEFSKKIIQIMDDFYFRSSTESLWLPKSNPLSTDFKDGVIGYDNPDTSKPKFGIEESELFEKLSNAEEISIKGHPVFISKDKSVRFTPFGFKTGIMSSSKLAKNPYNIVLHGEEGAEKSAKISEHYNEKPHLWAYESVNNKQRTLSALNDFWCFDRRLYVNGSNSGDNDYDHSIGVLASQIKSNVH